MLRRYGSVIRSCDHKQRIKGISCKKSTSYLKFVRHSCQEQSCGLNVMPYCAGGPFFLGWAIIKGLSLSVAQRRMRLLLTETYPCSLICLCQDISLELYRLWTWKPSPLVDPISMC